MGMIIRTKTSITVGERKAYGAALLARKRRVLLRGAARVSDATAAVAGSGA
jgi:hypothetical protein